jgi:hypothetical protein
MNDQELMMKQLIEETYQEDVGPTSPVSLVNYFERRLNEVEYTSLKNYLKNEEVLFLPMTFNAANGCYRVALANTEIDFPSNWSIFSKFHTEHIVHVKANQDEDFLCEVFLSHVGEVKILVLASDNGMSRLIFLNSDKAEKQLEWIENYFKNKAEIEEKKAS